MTTHQKKTCRKQGTLRMRKLRESHAAATSPSTSTIMPTGHRNFASYSSERRAFMRASSALPRSPRKRKHILHALASSSGIVKKDKRQRNRLPDNVINNVKAYFERDDISRWCQLRLRRTLPQGDDDPYKVRLPRC